MEVAILNGLVKGIMMAIVLGIIFFIGTAIRKALKIHSHFPMETSKQKSLKNKFMQTMSASDWSAFELIVKTVRDSYPEEPDRGIFLRNAFKAALADRPTPQGDFYPCAFGTFSRDTTELYKLFQQAVEQRLEDIRQ